MSFLPPESAGGAPPLPGMGMVDLSGLSSGSFDGAFGAPNTQTPHDMALETTLPPYSIPVVKLRSRPPTAAWIEGQKRYRGEYWEGRDLAMAEDEAAYLMLEAHPTENKEGDDAGEEVIVSATLTAMVNKLGYIVGRQEDKIEVKPRSQREAYRVAAQRCEAFLYHTRKRSDRAYRAGGFQGIKYAEAYFGAVRGWVAGRVSFDPSRRWPFIYRPVDPANCYPRLGEHGAGFCVDMLHVEETTVGAFLSANPHYTDHDFFSGNDGEGLPDQTDIEVTTFEDARFTVVQVVVSGGGGVSAEAMKGLPVAPDRDEESSDPTVLDVIEHGYGFCPWVMLPVGGTPNLDEIARPMHGAGLLRPLRPIQAALDRLLSQVHTDVARMGNPPTIDTYDSRLGGSPPKPASVAPGANNVRNVGVGQSTEIIQVGARPDQVAMLHQNYQQQLDRAGLIGALWGDTTSMSSGFHFTIAKNAAEDAIFPVVDTIIALREMVNELLLNLVLVAGRREAMMMTGEIEDVGGPASAPAFRVPMAPRRRRRGSVRSLGEEGDPVEWTIITPDDVRLHGVDNEVKMRRMTLQDLLSTIQAAVMAAQTKVLSLRTIRRDWLDVDDLEEENRQIIYEGIYTDPEIMRNYLLPSILEEIDPELGQFMRMQQMAQMQQQMAQMQGGGPAGSGSSAGFGLPAEMVPSQMQGGPMAGGGDAEAQLAQLSEVVRNAGVL